MSLHDEELNSFKKLLQAARYWLLGAAQFDPEYYKVLGALEFSHAHHNGTRNGGEPEFTHQLSIFHYLRTLHNHLKNPVTVYILAFLHDVIEDQNQATKRFIAPAEISDRFGDDITTKVLKMSKQVLGQPNTSYSLQTIFEDQDCGPAKGGDRVHNVSTMYGVFKPTRLKRYVIETADDYLPRLKMARRLYPHQEPVYENMKLELVNQLILINHLMDASGSPEEVA
jgi:(p)ppGpp synthase/HD superfamily hydrolase